MKQPNFSTLMREVKALADLNAKELLLYEARAYYQQNVQSVGNVFLMQVESELLYIQKARELSATADEIQLKANNLKISTCLVFELLNLLGKGRNVNDLTTLAWFASIVTGFSRNSIQNTVQKGYGFSKQHHSAGIQEVNRVSERLQLPIFIDISKEY